MSQIWIFFISFTRTILVITTNFPDWNFSTCFYFWKHRVYLLLSPWVILFTMLSYIIFHKAIQWLLSTLEIKSKVFSGYLNLHEQAPASVLIIFSSFFLCSLHSPHRPFCCLYSALCRCVPQAPLFSVCCFFSLNDLPQDDCKSSCFLHFIFASAQRSQINSLTILFRITAISFLIPCTMSLLCYQKTVLYNCSYGLRSLLELKLHVLVRPLCLLTIISQYIQIPGVKWSRSKAANQRKIKILKYYHLLGYRKDSFPLKCIYFYEEFSAMQ